MLKPSNLLSKVASALLIFSAALLFLPRSSESDSKETPKPDVSPPVVDDQIPAIDPIDCKDESCEPDSNLQDCKPRKRVRLFRRIFRR